MKSRNQRTRQSRRADKRQNAHLRTAAPPGSAPAHISTGRDAFAAQEPLVPPVRPLVTTESPPLPGLAPALPPPVLARAPSPPIRRTSNGATQPRADSVPPPRPAGPRQSEARASADAEALLIAEIGRAETPEAIIAATPGPLPRHLALEPVRTGWLTRISRRFTRPAKPKVADEVRQLRADIAALRDAMDVLLTRTAAD